MSGQTVWTAHTIIVLASLGLGVLGWLLHKLGRVLKEFFEALAVIAVVFATVWLIVKGLVRLVRTICRHWRTSLTTTVVGAWCYWLGWQSLAYTLGAVVGVFGYWVLIVSWTGDWVAFDHWAGRHVRSWWLRWTLYARRMPTWFRACRLTVPDQDTGVTVSINLLRRSGMTKPVKPRRDQMPRILGVRSGGSWDEVRVRLVPGQTPEDFDQAARQLAVARKVSRCQVRELAPDVVSVDFQRRNLLADIVPGPRLAALGSVAGSEIDLSRVWAGRTEYGADWTVSLLGSHTLTAGETGAGKGTVLWSPLVSIAPAIRDGLVRVSGVDPKGMELAYGRGVFHRYTVTSRDTLALLDELVAAMEARKREWAGRVRTVPITKENPLELIEFDELGALTKYVGDRKTRDAIIERIGLINTQGRALGFAVRGYVQEPNKDTVPIRELFPRRICLRVPTKSHVAMALGDHAYDRGAWANRIGESEAGVGYLFGEGIREPLRVRAGWVTDVDIKALEAFVTSQPETAGQLLSLPAPAPQPAGGVA
jgi:S-DNA-T family DNA segregation ATPase FtsK/SpoIIIE